MLNPYQFSGSYDELLKRMLQHAQQTELDQRILAQLKQFFEKEIDKENRPFSRPDRKRLFQQVSKAILTDVLKQIDGDS